MDSERSKGTAEAVLTYQKRDTCRLCHGARLEPVLNLGTQFLPRFVKEVDQRLPQAPLELIRCDTCGLLQLQHTVNPDLLFREFWYRSGINEGMRDALYDVVRSGLNYFGEGVWLDIGANDGYLLSRVPSTFKKIAVEPALNFKAELEEHADVVISDYFSQIDEKCNVITSCAMFYDLDEPGDFVKDIVETLTDDGIWINQLNDSPTMLKQNAFDSICHEHLTYYDVHSLNKLYEAYGLKIVALTYNNVNGGSIRVVASKKGYAIPLMGHGMATTLRCELFGKRVARWKDRTTEILGGLAHKSPLWCYGASTKGSVLLQYLDAAEWFLAIADRNPSKVGLRMAGPWLPIVDEATFRKEKPRYAVALPWAFRDEFLAREQALMAEGTTLIMPLPNLEFCV